MKRLTVSFIALLMWSIPGLHAVPNPQINTAYQSIHEHVCADLGISTPCPPSLNDDEKWAFVMTWCARHPGEVLCKSLPQTGGPVVIAYDHDGRGWRPIYGVNPNDVETDANGVPRVLTATGRTVMAVVESTNPLAYKAEAGAVTETNAEVVDNLQKLFAKLGPALGGLVALAADGILPRDKQSIDDLTAAAQKIQCIPDQWVLARDFTQHVEDREQATYQILRQKCSAMVGLKAAYTTLENAKAVVAKIDFCSAEVAKISEWLNLSPTNVKALREKQKEIKLNVDCETRLLETKRLIDGRLDRLDAADKAAAKQPTQTNLDALDDAQEDWRDESGPGRDALARLTDLATKAAEAVTAATELLKTENKSSVEAVILNIDRFERRLLTSAATTRTITQGTYQTTDVADFFVVPYGPIVVAWTKNRARTLTITKASPFDKLVLSRPDTLATSYGAGSLSASLVDMNVALTHTQLASPVFGMVSAPAPTAADPNATKNVIGKTKEEDRSGQLAVIVSFPVLHRLSDSAWARRIGLELGAGASTSTPALFLGPSFKLNKAVRLGFGATLQQIGALNGQKVGDTIKAETDIKRKNVRKESWYVSFSLNLESIGSLFTAN